MKKYQLKLKGTKKNNTEDITMIIYGDNKSHAFTWAYNFFKQGEFKDPYYATGLQKNVPGTEGHIPGAKDSLRNLAGKYFVPRTAVTVIK